VDIDWKIARPYPVGQPSSKGRVGMPLSGGRREACSGAKDDKLAELDVVCTRLAA